MNTQFLREMLPSSFDNEYVDDIASKYSDKDWFNCVSSIVSKDDEDKHIGITAVIDLSTFKDMYDFRKFLHEFIREIESNAINEASTIIDKV